MFYNLVKSSLENNKQTRNKEMIVTTAKLANSTEGFIFLEIAIL